MTDTNHLPNLAKVATADLVEVIGTGNFKASYINWARTVQLLREHAPGWEPEIVLNANGDVLHRAPVGAFMMLRFRSGERITEAVPQAVMDNRNAAIPFDKITARDITDTHRRGICLAAAMTFGLAYELWAKMPLEKGYSEGADGAASGASRQDSALSTINQEQLAELERLMDRSGTAAETICKGYKIDAVALLPVKSFPALKKRLEGIASELERTAA